MLKTKLIVVFVIFICAFPVSAQQMEYVNSTLWNGVNDIEIVDNYAYCGFVNGLVILDYTDAEYPVEISRLYTEGETFAVAIESDLALLASGTAGLQVIDISDIESPQLISTFHTGGEIIDLEITGDYAFLADNDKGIYAIDFSDPEHLEQVYYQSYSLVMDITGYNNMLYISSDIDGVIVYDIANPELPELITTIPIPAGCNKAFIDGDILYAFNNWGSGLLIFDITDPYTPQLLSQLNEGYIDIHIRNDYAYILTWDDDLIVVDISDPSAPVVVNRIAVSGLGTTLAYGNGMLYAAFSNRGIYSYDISTQDTPELVNHYTTSRRIFTSEKHDGLLYAGGFHIVDNSNPSLPEVLGRLILPEWVTDYYITDTHAFVAAGDNTLYIIEITNPFTPDIVGTYTAPSSIRGIAVKDNLAYLLLYQADMQIIDLDYLEFPSLVAEYDISATQPTSMTKNGDYLYISDDYLGLLILDISNSLEPEYISEFYVPHYCKSVDIVDSRAYLVTCLSYHIIDVGDPYNPSQVVAWGAQGQAQNMWTDGHYAYLAENDIWICDISDLPNIYSVARYNTPGWATDVAVDGEYVYISDRNSLITCRFSPTGIDDTEPIVPSSYHLAGNYPNPFNASTNISYDIPSATDVRIDIYDILGRKVETLVDSYHQAGRHNVTWHASDKPSGIYLYKIQAGDFSQTRKCIMIK